MQLFSALIPSPRLSPNSTKDAQAAARKNLAERSLTFAEEVQRFFEYVQTWFSDEPHTICPPDENQIKDAESMGVYDELDEINQLEQQLARDEEAPAGCPVTKEEVADRYWVLWRGDNKKVTYDNEDCFYKLKNAYGEQIALFVQGKIASLNSKFIHEVSPCFASDHDKIARECFTRIDPVKFDDGKLFSQVSNEAKEKHNIWRANDSNYEKANTRLLDQRREQLAFERIMLKGQPEGSWQSRSVGGPRGIARASNPIVQQSNVSDQSSNLESSQSSGLESSQTFLSILNKEQPANSGRLDGNLHSSIRGEAQGGSDNEGPDSYMLTTSMPSANTRNLSRAASIQPTEVKKNNVQLPVRELPEGVASSSQPSAKKTDASSSVSSNKQGDHINDDVEELSANSSDEQQAETSVAQKAPQNNVTTSAKPSVSNLHDEKQTEESANLSETMATMWGSLVSWATSDGNEIQNALRRHEQEIASNNSAVDEILSISQQVLAKKDIKNLAAAYDALYKVQLTRPDYRTHEVLESIDSFWEYGKNEYNLAQKVKGTPFYWEHCRRAAFAGHLKANYELAAESPAMAYKHFLGGNKRLAGLALQGGNSCYLRLARTSKPNTADAVDLMATVM